MVHDESLLIILPELAAAVGEIFLGTSIVDQAVKRNCAAAFLPLASTQCYPFILLSLNQLQQFPHLPPSRHPSLLQHCLDGLI
jgi:hypothetical protein